MPTIEEMMNMTDEQLAALEAFPEPAQPEQEPVDETPVEEAPVEGETPIETPVVEGDAGEAGAVEEGAEGDDDNGGTAETANLSDSELPEAPETKKSEAPVDPVEKPAEGVAAPKTEGEATPAASTAGEGKEEAPQIDFKVEYEKLIGVPIRANGRDITLKSADEALRLIQQGAGYAQKMEQLKPARKSAAMLEAAGLLGDEAALAQMIDLYRGDPKAIAKMLKDTNTDVFGLDLEAGETYTPNSHLQSDAAVTFNDTLKEVRALEGGREALTLIDGMDEQSRKLIWGNAEAVRQIYDLKRNGVYDTVATELERRRVLGEIPEGVPYILAFQKVGEEIAKANEAAVAARQAAEQIRTPQGAEPAKPAPRAPVATGAAPRKPEASNAQAAAAAAAPRIGAGKAKPVVDIYSLSDADIEKMSAFPG